MDFLTFRSNALQSLSLVKDHSFNSKDEVEEWVKREYNRHYKKEKDNGKDINR